MTRKQGAMPMEFVSFMNSEDSTLHNVNPMRYLVLK